MTKGNGKLEGTIELGQGDPAAKEVVLNLVQFMQEVAQALDALANHQAAHCRQIGMLQDEVAALKKGLSAKPETVNFGEANG